MAEEILRSKHAFGSSENLAAAIEAGKIDSYDILFLDGETNPKVGWLDKNGDVRIVDTENIITVDGESLPESGVSNKIYIFGEDGYFWDGEKFVCLSKSTDLSALEAEIAKKVDLDQLNAKFDEAVSTAKSYTDEKSDDVLNEVKDSYEKIKYEITNTPVGTLVKYGEKEIRVMCPTDTEWVKQTVGATGNANYYYMGFKAYAPEGAVSFKEGDQGVIEDEMFDFSGDFAGTDEYGRNYSICWLALASYDEASDTWTYFGKNSSTSKYIGWTYVVEWYNTNGVVIASDSIRINLSNEECHSVIEPYYISSATNESKAYTDEQIATILSSMAIVEF